MEIILYFLLFHSGVQVVNADFVAKTKEDLGAARTYCVDKLSVPENLVAEFRKWNFPDEEITRCYMKCMLTELGLFDPAKGAPKVDNLVVQFGGSESRPTIKSEIQECIDNNNDAENNCSLAFLQFVCFISKNLSLVQDSVKN